MKTLISILSLFVVLSITTIASAEIRSVDMLIAADGATLTERANAMGTRACRNRSVGTWKVGVWDAQSHMHWSMTGENFHEQINVEVSSPFALEARSGNCRLTWDPALNARMNGFMSILVRFDGQSVELAQRLQAETWGSIEATSFMVAIPARRSRLILVATNH